MQLHRTARPAALAAPGSIRFEIQRELLLELVVEPPAGGEPVAALAARLGRSRGEITAAARALEAAGLAERDGRGVRASPAARAFEALWPTRL